MSRSSKDQTEERVAEALELLMDGYAPGSIAKMQSRKYEVTLRQGRRYVAAAQLDYFSEPMTRNDLEWGVARQLERMEEIAQHAMHDKDTKIEIKARQAFAGMAENRLKAKAREQEYLRKVEVM
jgi:hypothetical protein